MLNFILLFQDADAAEQSFSIFSIIMKGGVLGIVIMSILFFLALFGLYIFIERYLTIRQASNVDDAFMTNIRTNVVNGNMSAALDLCRKEDTPVARMVQKGIERIGKPMKDINQSIENVGNLEVFKLEKNLSRLATVAGAAPMIGFFGTVTGMIMAFYTMANQQNVTPDALAGGIYQALLTTAAGLLIGILAYFGYNILVSMVNKAVFKMEATSMEFVDLLQEPAK